MLFSKIESMRDGPFSDFCGGEGSSCHTGGVMQDGCQRMADRLGFEPRYPGLTDRLITVMIPAKISNPLV